MNAGRLRSLLVAGVLVAGMSSIARSGHAAPYFEFTGSGQPGDYIGGGQTFFRTQDFGTLFQNVLDLTGDGQPDYVDIFILGNTLGQFMSIAIGTNQLGQNLHPGVYPNAERAPFASAGHPGVDIEIDGRGCNTLTGSFVIYDIAFAPGNVLDRLDVAFEQHCEGATPAFIGRFRYDRTNPLRPLVADVPALSPIAVLLLASLIAVLAAACLKARVGRLLSDRSSLHSPSPHGRRN